MISLFEVLLEREKKTESQFPHPARPDADVPLFLRLARREGSIYPQRGRGEIFFKQAADNVYAFSRGRRRGKTTASGLEFTGNNTGARATRREPPSIRGAIRSPGVATPPSLPQLLNCQSQPEVSGGLRELHLVLASRRDASAPQRATFASLPAAADKPPELLGGTRGTLVWNFT